MNQEQPTRTTSGPSTAADTTLEPGTFDFYLRNNETGTTFALLGQNQAFTDRNGTTDGFGELNKFALGNNRQCEVNSFSIDDVLLRTTSAKRLPSSPSLGLRPLGLGSLLALRRRR
jgi:hypothetical protein